MSPGPATALRWRKLGLVFRPDTALGWVAHSALNPTPVKLDASTIRVFAGMRDAEGRSRVGWVDVDGDEPQRVLGWARAPALDIGAPGEFDDSGVVPCALTQVGDELRLYYTGYQLLRSVRMLIFTGLAVSHDGGESFRRLASTPVLDRAPGESQFRGLSCIEAQPDGWRTWYAAGAEWNTDGDRPTPRYDVRCTFSSPLWHPSSRGTWPRPGKPERSGEKVQRTS